MRAALVEVPGGPEAISIADLPVPEPGPGQVRIRNAWAGINFFEVLIRSGRYLRPLKYPLILGGECSGVIDALGEGVSGLAIGQRVAALTGDAGAYADFVCADSDAVFPLPDNVSLEQGAAYPLQVLTAWGVLFASARLREGDSVLVHAAAGGVGQALVQMAKAKGCTVYATAGSADKLEAVRALGADHLINYREKDFGREIQALTSKRGVDIICDSVGKDNVIGNLRSISNFGLIVVFGYASGEPKYDERLLWGRSCGISMNGLYHLLPRKELMARAVPETLGAIAAGTLKLSIDSSFPLEQVREAQTKLEGRGTIGKVLLEIDPSIK